MIAFRCTSCRMKLSVKDELAGKKIRCPSCRASVTVPAPKDSPVPASAAGPLPDSPTLAPAGANVPPPPDQVTLPPPGVSDATNPPDALRGEHPAALTDFLAPPQAADELGRLGGFRILKILGHGGMGVVYQAEDPRLGRQVALEA